MHMQEESVGVSNVIVPFQFHCKARFKGIIHDVAAAPIMHGWDGLGQGLA